jgi:hypothetical protein
MTAEDRATLAKAERLLVESRSDVSARVADGASAQALALLRGLLTEGEAGQENDELTKGEK